MKPTWVIETGVYGEEIEPLLAEIRRQGMLAEAIPFEALQKNREVRVGQILADGDCVVGYGTFPFAREIQLHRRWFPGAWCHPENLDCSEYFKHFGKFLLNQPYAILSGVDAIRQQDRLFRDFAKNDEVFARPTGCHKLFTGRCIYKDDFTTALAPTRYDPATQVVIATPQEIWREWRLVVRGDEVIAASQYALEGTKYVQAGCPQEVRSYAEAMLAEVQWRPDPIFMLDVCECEAGLSLVEINGFSCSWLYACDLEAVVQVASKLAKLSCPSGHSG